MQVQRSIGKTGRTVKRSWHRAALIFAFFVVFLAVGAVWARPWLRERWYDYRDARMRAEVPEAVGYKEQGTGNREQVSAGTSPVILEERRLDATIESTTSSQNLLDSIAAPGAPLQNDREEEPSSLQNDKKEINLKIPFVSQAPHRNWDMPYQEACEEASAIMASLYYQGDTRDMVIGDAGDALLQKVIAWEKERFGYYEDTTIAETVIMLEEYFKLRARIVDDPTVEQIKEAVAAGHPVIVPAYGKILPNPYFKNGGPLYHMLIVKGYTETKFITNDPGTNTRGAEFTYKYDALMNAIHDWNDGDVSHGAKRIIIVEGPMV